MAREPGPTEWEFADVINGCLPEIDETIRDAITKRIDEIHEYKQDNWTQDAVSFALEEERRSKDG